MQNISRTGPLQPGSLHITWEKYIYIIVEVCFLRLTIGSKRKEFGLPIRNRDMAHDYKLAPVLDDHINYTDCCKELDVWVELTELSEEKKALAIFSSLQGKPKKVDIQLEIKDLKVTGGVKKLKETLDKAFSKDKKKATYDAYDKFERFKRSNEMSLAGYTIEFEELLYCLEKCEIKLPPVVVAYRHLNSANLTEVQSTIVRTTISD